MRLVSDGYFSKDVRPNIASYWKRKNIVTTYKKYRHGKDMNNPPGKYQRSNVWYNDTSRHRKSRPQKRKKKKRPRQQRQENIRQTNLCDALGFYPTHGGV
jgi:replication initiation and membrane attachment protein DnaB